MSENDYTAKADLWPLNPNGELVNWTIIESKEGLEKTREIAAVKGIGVLWPGAGTLRGLFSTQQPKGTRKLDEAAWEASIQKVLAACKDARPPTQGGTSVPPDHTRRAGTSVPALSLFAVAPLRSRPAVASPPRPPGALSPGQALAPPELTLEIAPCPFGLPGT